MKRRAFTQAMVWFAGMFAVPARAQVSGRTYRIGALLPFYQYGGERFRGALRERLAEHGFIEGRNLAIDWKYPLWYRDHAERYAREFAAQKIDAIFALTTIVAQGALDGTRTVPIVFAWVADPVFSKLVGTYARPGGNATGVSNRFFELYVKRLELVRELVPQSRRVAVIAGVFESTLEAAWKLAEPFAAKLGIEPIRIEAGGDWPGSVRRARDAGAEAILVTTPFPQFGLDTAARQFVASAAGHRIPVVYTESDTVAAGGLVSYGTNPLEDLRRGVDVLARVLKGEAPATLPIDQASRFELVVNLKAARAIDFRVPGPVLLRADRVIE